MDNITNNQNNYGNSNYQNEPNNYQNNQGNYCQNSAMQNNNGNFNVKRQVSDKDIIKLIIGVVNVSSILPVVTYFMAFWWIFGGFIVSRFVYGLSLCIYVVYLLLSILFLLKSIWDVIKYNKTARNIFKIFVVIGIIYVVMKFCA